jgi:hypothetical protein
MINEEGMDAKIDEHVHLPSTEQQQQQPTTHVNPAILSQHILATKHDSSNSIVADSDARSTDLVNAPPNFYIASCASQFSHPILNSIFDSKHINKANYCKSMSAAASCAQSKCLITLLPTSTPMHAREWAAALIASDYPNRPAALLLVASIQAGVDIGFTGDRTVVQECINLPTASEYEQAVDEAMIKEVQVGRRAGPFDKLPFAAYRCSPIGTVEKKRSTKRRLIHHLSWPRHAGRHAAHSVNDSLTEFAVKLDAFERAIQAVRACGVGCYISKIDIESAYRCIPVRPADWPLLCMQWRGKYYFDKVLPFGLATATAIFEWYSTAAEHITRVLGKQDNFIHYVDDFVNVTKTEQLGQHGLAFICKTFDKLGLPIAPDKLEQPQTRVIFLGIIIDTEQMTLSLDETRLGEIKSMLVDWQSKTHASKRELQTIIGILSFASKAVVSGRSFLRRMIDAMKAIPDSGKMDQEYPLKEQFFQDLQWWHTFVEAWNGTSLILENEWTPSSALHIYTDACQSGFSGVSKQGWYAHTWTDEQEALAARNERDSMPWKELFAIAVAAQTFGPKLASKRVQFHCDCMPAVLAWQKGSSRDNSMSELIRTLLFSASLFSFEVQIIHIPGVENVHADLLSRGLIQEYMASPTKPSHSQITASMPPTNSW